MAIEGEEKLLTLDEALRASIPPSAARPLDAGQVPATVQVILAARIDRLATAPGAAGVRVW